MMYVSFPPRLIDSIWAGRRGESGQTGEAAVPIDFSAHLGQILSLNCELPLHEVED